MYLHYLNSHKNIVIIGGGLAGLCSAIHLAKMGIRVTLVEKNEYPKHKVCGEYISNEVLPYFEYLDLDIESLGPVHITALQLSNLLGNSVFHKLPLGGFGISRYTLDHYLYTKAKKTGVEIVTDRIISLDKKTGNGYTMILASGNQLTAGIVIGAYGKRSSLDKSLSRDFHQKKSPWLAVKAHYRADFDTNLVALHNFEGGYCGLSKVENSFVNACYLVHYDSFKRFKDIHSFQKEVMYKNKCLKAFFENAEMVFEKPLTISQVNFSKKKSNEAGVPMIGDAAGLIHPLCGNGMAMAIQGGKMVSELLIRQQKGEITQTQLEKLYDKEWQNAFSGRLKVGRLLQKILLNSSFQNMAYKAVRLVPALVPQIIKKTHGKPLVCHEF